MPFKTVPLKQLLFILGWSIPTTLILEFVEKWIYSDWDFLVFLGILIVLDTISGFVKAYKTNSVHSKKFADLIIKVLIYILLLITIHVLMNFTVNGKHPKFVAYIDDFLLTAMMVREALSIFENLAIINPNLVPKSILRKLKQFDNDTGEVIDDKNA